VRRSFPWVAGVLLATAAPPLRAQQTWVKQPSAFPVTDSLGVVIPQPFLGGFNAPRPQLVDIDGDGDQDLFVQELAGAVALFERTPGGGLVWRTDRFQDLDVGEWYRFADADGDGDWDLFGEAPFSHIRYFRNDGTARAPRFVLAADTLKDVTGAPIFADRQNILQVLDVDCDGRLDLLIGLVAGTVNHYETAEPVRPGAVPRFAFGEERWQGIEIVALLPGSMHGANTMAFGDLDRDGDPDLLWGDYFEPGVLQLENRGSCRETVLGEPVPFPPGAPLRTSGYNAPTIGDVDGDGDADVVVGTLGGAYNANRTSIENLHLIEQTAPQAFTVRTSRLLPTLDLGIESAVTAGDVDGDGDIDLVVGTRIDPTDVTTGRLYLLENTGRARAPAFRLQRLPAVQGLFHVAPVLGDLDGDGDLDLLLGSWRDVVQYWRNDGGAAATRWVVADTALVRITRGSNTTPALADLDGDGDLDLVIGESAGTLNYYRNDGTRTAPRFTLVSDEWEGVDVGRRSAPAFGDLDGDGDLDLLVGSEEDAVVLRNTGTRQDPRFVADRALAASLGLSPYTAAAIVDVDGDGLVDVVAGTFGGGVVMLKGRRLGG